MKLTTQNHFCYRLYFKDHTYANVTKRYGEKVLKCMEAEKTNIPLTNLGSSIKTVYDVKEVIDLELKRKEDQKYKEAEEIKYKDTPVENCDKEIAKCREILKNI